jgi:serine/threonine protein kinase/Tol biopolymer transport system component
VPLATGTRLGPYEIVAPLGAGGMGEVYRARDAKLDRFVAIKVLPPHLVADAVALGRFEREAKAVAALSHPNILSIFDFGREGDTAYAVMELLEGETLREKLEAPIPIRKAIDYGAQIARGLAAAHAKGIAHRDLKPENVFVTTDGRVKILDFGLARNTVKLAGSADVTTVPGFSRPTDPGTVLGTVGYMSPEQARGEPGDQRSDIFSLGVVLYELVSGRRAFHRETAAETMTAILREEPPALTESSSAAVPPGIARVIDHCLEKTPGERFQSASDVAFALENLSGSSSSGVQAVAGTGWRGRAWLPWAVATVLALALIALLVSNARRPAATTPATTRLSVTLPETMAIARITSPSHTLAISPGGERIVFTGALGPGRVQLYLRALDALKVEPIPGTDGARQPFFSPDGMWVAFFTTAGELKKVPLAGGSPVTVARGLLNGQWTFGVWRNDDVIVFAATDTLKQVPASGGTPSNLTTVDAAKGRELHHAPQVVPGTGDILFTVYGDGTPHVDILQWDSRARSTVLENAKDTVLTASGHLVFVRDGTLMAAPFDARQRTAGQPVALPESVSIDNELYETPQLAVSSTGTMAYVPADAETERPAIGWVTRTGEFQEVGTLPRRAQAAALSPDGQRAAILAGTQLLLFDLRRGVATTIEARESDRDSLGWYTDGKQITLGGGALSLFDPDTGKDTALTELGRLKRFPSWSRDGRTVAYMTFNPTNDIYVLSLDDGKGPRALVATDANEDAPAVSPDGQWLAYTSTQAIEATGRTDVFIVRFPEGTGRTQISGNGAGRPIWSRDSRELFFGAPPGVLQSVSIAPGDTLQVGDAKTLFQLTNLRIVAAAPDGRFLAFREPPRPRPTEIVVVQNWLNELTRLVPARP